MSESLDRRPPEEHQTGQKTAEDGREQEQVKDEEDD